MTRKVIHIWGICGIGGLLSRYMDEYLDYESVCISRKEFDKFLQITEKSIRWHNSTYVWILRCLFKARDYDIIHIHSGIRWIKYFKLLYPYKRIVIHLHGTRIRGRWHEEDLSNADLILVSTPDLLEGAPDRALYLPNPVNEKLINHINELKIKKKKGSAFHVERYALDKAIEFCEDRDLELTVHDRDATPMMHEEFLKHMAEYEYYINVERSRFLHKVSEHEYYVDVKRDYPTYRYQDTILEAFSLTGLEALALGCKVINWNNKVFMGLPPKHRGINVANRLDSYYDGVML